MSADTTPISPSRFAAALKDLSLPMLRLKTLEIRNSIAHLYYSNDQLRPFAEGTQQTRPEGQTIEGGQTAEGGVQAQGDGDQDCVEAIRENEVVIERMAERIALIRAEVESRGASWREWRDEGEIQEERALQQERGEGREEGRDPWRDGTFQTGRIRGGRVEWDERPGEGREEGRDDGADDARDDEGGLHL